MPASSLGVDPIQALNLSEDQSTSPDEIVAAASRLPCVAIPRPERTVTAAGLADGLCLAVDRLRDATGGIAGGGVCEFTIDMNVVMLWRPTFALNLAKPLGRNFLERATAPGWRTSVGSARSGTTHLVNLGNDERASLDGIISDGWASIDNGTCNSVCAKATSTSTRRAIGRND